MFFFQLSPLCFHFSHHGANSHQLEIAITFVDSNVFSLMVILCDRVLRSFSLIKIFEIFFTVQLLGLFLLSCLRSAFKRKNR